MTGRFVAVVGPSGAGKDTLIDLARAALKDDPRFMFQRRLITRPPAAGEDHDPISEADFDGGAETESFALYWRAHGLGYAVPASAARAVTEGRVVVCNLSRETIPDARARLPTVVALVTAPAEVRAARIAARGRETGALVESRVAREVAPIEAELTIQNIGAPGEAAETLIAFLRGLG